MTDWTSLGFYYWKERENRNSMVINRNRYIKTSRYEIHEIWHNICNFNIIIHNVFIILRVLFSTLQHQPTS